MKNPALIAVYGSYGYTGTLIVELCKSLNLQLVLAGRNRESLSRQSKATGYPFEVVDCGDEAGLRKLLEPVTVVIHCGGPFKHTARAMAEACMATRTHYTDITGEHQVFELLAAMDARAKSADIMVMPGTGFDVVPSDCLAAHLKARLPSATHLQLAFASSGAGASRGTRKTSVESLLDGAWVRKDNRLARIQFGSRIMDVDFGSFRAKALCIPWGDISTAWRSTGIPNIEVYMSVTDKMIKTARMSNYFRWALRLPFVMRYVMNKLDLKSPGPSQARREQGKSFFWGRVVNAAGEERTSRMVTQNGYSLTALTAVGIAQKILARNFKIGYQTPSTAYGVDLILEVPGTTRTDI